MNKENRSQKTKNKWKNTETVQVDAKDDQDLLNCLYTYKVGMQCKRICFSSDTLAQYEATRRAMAALNQEESITGPKDDIPIYGDDTEGLNES